MNEILKIGQEVRIESSGAACKVLQFLGGGGQGEVYRAQLGGSEVALKWYFPHTASEQQRESLVQLIDIRAPDQRFLWPMDMANSPDVKGFGYIMRLREPRFKSIVDLMKRRIDPSFRVLATAGFQLADSFLHLHSRGLCYRDVSFGNAFFDPQTGDVLVCDNDNVTINGAQDGGILGTPRFMAPEVVRGEARPSTDTDLFSLAVLLFYMFVVHHPLEGKQESSIRCLDLPAMTKLYGTDPVFIHDPVNDANRPVPGFHDNAITYWEILPTFLREVFIRAFTEGIHDPQHGRVRESRWRVHMVRLRDSIFYCPCGAENFYDGEALRKTAGRSACWSCHRDLSLPPRLRFGSSRVVMLNFDTKLFPHHIDQDREYDFSAPIAEVNQNPNNPAQWGLKNLSQEKWVSTGADGSIVDVEPGRSAGLAQGKRINFGKREAEIRI